MAQGEVAEVWMYGAGMTGTEKITFNASGMFSSFLSTIPSEVYPNTFWATGTEPRPVPSSWPYPTGIHFVIWASPSAQIGDCHVEIKFDDGASIQLPMYIWEVNRQTMARQWQEQIQSWAGIMAAVAFLIPDSVQREKMINDFVDAAWSTGMFSPLAAIRYMGPPLPNIKSLPLLWASWTKGS